MSSSDIALPTPKIGYINDLRPFDDIYSLQQPHSDGEEHYEDNDDISTKLSTPNQRTRQNTSFTYPDIDPWGEDSATVPRIPGATAGMSGAPPLHSSMTAPNLPTGLGNAFGEDLRKTSLDPTGAAAGGIGNGLGGFQPPPLATRSTFGSGAWADAFPDQPGLYGPTSDAFGSGGFEGVRVDRSQIGTNNLSRTLGGSSKIPPPPRDDDEVISIIMLPEKEGVFMFQHRNYEVKSSKRGTSVIRRYSDFVWLHDCLIKIYPFRQIPLLPPKRVAGESFSTTFLLISSFFHFFLGPFFPPAFVKLLTVGIFLSQWHSPRSRFNLLPRQTPEGPYSIHKCTGSASRAKSGAIGHDVPYCPDCKRFSIKPTVKYHHPNSDEF